MNVNMESHNEYITFVLQNGLQSFLPIMVLGVWLMASWLQCIIRKAPHRPGPGVTVLFVCIMLTAFFEPIFTNCTELGMLFGAIMGILIASVIYAGSESKTYLYSSEYNPQYPPQALASQRVFP